MPVILAMAVGSLFADPKPALVVQVVSTEGTDAYNARITRINALIKVRTGVERLRRVWIGDMAGESFHGVFAVSAFPSAAAVYQIQDKVKDTRN